MSRTPTILLLLLLCGCASGQTLNIGTLTVGSVVVGSNNTVIETGLSPAATGLIASTTANNTTVTIHNPGTNIFTTGEIIELFDVGPRVLNGIRESVICLIQNVSANTNITLLYLCGVTSTNVACRIGKNNRVKIQADYDLAKTHVPNIFFIAQPGTFMVCADSVLTTNLVMPNEFAAQPDVVLDSGGVTILGTNGTILMTPGASMYHWVTSLNDYRFLRSTLFWQVPSSNVNYPLMIANLTEDGGVTNGYDPGLTADLTSDAIITVWDGTGTPAFPVQTIHSNCFVQHWRGEMHKGTVSTAVANVRCVETNCTFADGGLTALNNSFAQTIGGCTFSNIFIMEFYRAYTTAPSYIVNNTWTNTHGLWVLNGSLNTAEVQPILIAGNHGFIPLNQVFLTMTPAANVTYSNNTIFGANGYGISSTAAGLQGTAFNTNVVIRDSDFGDVFWPIQFDGYAATNWLVTNITSTSTHDFAVIIGAGFKLGINLYGISCPSPAESTLVNSGGQYFYDDASNNHGPHQVPSGGGDSLAISYGTGNFQQLIPSVGGKSFYMSYTDSNTIPVGLHGELPPVVLSNANFSGFDTTVYYSNLTASIVLHPGNTCTNKFTNGVTWTLSN